MSKNAPKRPIRIEGDVAYVPLSRGYEAVIDAVDVPLIEALRWRVHVGKRTAYALHSGPRPARCNIFMHRLLMREPDGLRVDHKDGNGLNNRKDNLRPATDQQNSFNSRIPSNNTSGFKGVSWHKRDHKWRARITFGGKRRHLGDFNTPEDAHKAYAKASAELHGEFGRVA
jgi:AP2 domain/HNH endonuclease